MRLATLCFLLAACGEPPVAPQHDPTPAPSPAPVASETPPKDVPPEPVGAAVRVGKVLEVLDGAPRYTFARMDACGVEAWVAGPKVEMEVGQAIEMVGGQGMADFKSEALARSFDQLLMVDGWKLASSEPDCSAAAPPQTEGKGGEPLRFGTIQEEFKTDSYSFLRLDVCGDEVWVAGPARNLEVGGLVGMPLGMENKGFFSPSMEKKFDSIYFVQWIKKAKALPPCPPG